MNGPEEMRACHAAWQRETGQQLPLDFARENLWAQWIVAVRPLCDPGQPIANAVFALARHRRLKYKEARHIMASTLAFRYFVGNTDYAQEDLAEAKARLRARSQRIEPARAAVLRATGRPDAEDTAKENRQARPASEILARLGDIKRQLSLA